MKNITLSANAQIIEKARKKARNEKTSLNKKFREWLDDYIISDSGSKDFDLIMEKFGHIDLSGRKFTREEMNER